MDFKGNSKKDEANLVWCDHDRGAAGLALIETISAIFSSTLSHLNAMKQNSSFPTHFILFRFNTFAELTFPTAYIWPTTSTLRLTKLRFSPV